LLDHPNDPDGETRAADPAAGATPPGPVELPDASGPAWIRGVLERYERPLVLYASRLVGDPARAQDVVQETFLRLCRAERADVEPRLPAWLYTVCRNRALDEGKKESRMTRLIEEAARPPAVAAGGADPAQAAERSEGAARVLRQLETLPANQREVLRLKFQHGFAYREIAEVTGLSVGNVGFLIHVGLKTLRSRLAPTGAEPLPRGARS
jgi:RNA polymerase sigma-70 factor (ECF subfamily)